jgi:hypothetical protein
MFLPLDSRQIMGRAPRCQRAMVSSLIGGSRNAGTVMEAVPLEALAIRRQRQATDVRDHATPEALTLDFHHALHLGVLFRIIAAIFSATGQTIASGSNQDMVGLE